MVMDHVVALLRKEFDAADAAAHSLDEWATKQEAQARGARCNANERAREAAGFKRAIELIQQGSGM